MKTMHLFAGAGGGLLADLILGHEPICAVEWDKYACQILRERVNDGWFPNLHVYEGDIRLFNPSDYTGRVDCIHAGFPCQDISVAGKQVGLGEGTRSGLYREVLRIADVVKPRHLFLENVSAIVSMGSDGIGAVLADLSKMGYDSKWITLRASDVGAHHHRNRWWLLATNTQHGMQQILPSKQRINHKKNESRNISRTIDTRSRLERIRELENICGESALLGSDNDVANKVDRLKAIGNGQVPLQAAVAFQILMEMTK